MKSIKGHNQIILLFALFSIGSALSFSSNASSDNQAIAKIFEEHNIEGTIVIQKLGMEGGSGERHTHNPSRASKRFSPASTFKIPNTLIALDQGVVSSKESPFKWDGQQRWLDAWNKDQTLLSAFRVSCVWCYQQVARRLGREVYLEQLEELDYGNRKVGDQVSQFWLDGSLTISALEQISFLTQLINNELPLALSAQKLTKEIMLEPSSKESKIFSKTGWAAGDINIGWYVGYVETEKGTWVFAMNMDLSEVERAPLRKRVVMDALHHLNVL